MNEFGDFIHEKRVGLKLSMRDVAKKLDISAPFLSDVEKGRRGPFDYDKLKLLVEVLDLSEEEEHKMLDLAGQYRDTIAPDLPEYIKEKEYVSAALRTARDLDAGEEEWKAFVEELRRSRD